MKYFLTITGQRELVVAIPCFFDTQGLMLNAQPTMPLQVRQCSIGYLKRLQASIALDLGGGIPDPNFLLQGVSQAGSETSQLLCK